MPDTTAQFKDIFSAIPDEAPEPGAMTNTEGGDVNQPFQAQIPLGDTNLYDHSAEQAAIDEQNKRDGVYAPPAPDAGHTAIRNPTMMVDSPDRLRDEMELRFQAEMGDTKVVVTAEDREAFVRSALHDTELILNIPIDALDLTIKVALPPDEFTNSATSAVNYWKTQKFIDDGNDVQWILAFQQLHAWYQIREIADVPTPWSDFWVDGMPKLSKIREKMRDHESFSAFFAMNATRWRMLLEAIRMAELKYKICLQNWKNRNFFSSADTG